MLAPKARRTTAPRRRRHEQAHYHAGHMFLAPFVRGPESCKPSFFLSVVFFHFCFSFECSLLYLSFFSADSICSCSSSYGGISVLIFLQKPMRFGIQIKSGIVSVLLMAIILSAVSCFLAQTTQVRLLPTR